MPAASDTPHVPLFLIESIFPGGRETTYPTRAAADGSGMLDALRSEITSTARECDVDLNVVDGLIGRAVQHLTSPDDGCSRGLHLRLAAERRPGKAKGFGWVVLTLAEARRKFPPASDRDVALAEFAAILADFFDLDESVHSTQQLMRADMERDLDRYLQACREATRIAEHAPDSLFFELGHLHRSIAVFPSGPDVDMLIVLEQQWQAFAAAHPDTAFDVETTLHEIRAHLDDPLNPGGRRYNPQSTSYITRQLPYKLVQPRGNPNYTWTIYPLSVAMARGEEWAGLHAAKEKFEQPARAFTVTTANRGPWHRVTGKSDAPCRVCDQPIRLPMTRSDTWPYYLLIGGTGQWADAAMHVGCALATEKFHPDLVLADD